MLERSLSANTVEAYLRDVQKLVDFFELHDLVLTVKEIQLTHLQDFIYYINQLGIGERSQARTISGLKAFFKYLMIEDALDDSPAELLDGPKLPRKLPSVLSYDEIGLMLDAVKDYEKDCHLQLRNLAIIETLYACGLRVSELVNLTQSNVHEEVGFVQVIGKNNKERLVPIGGSALKAIGKYFRDEDHGRSIKINAQKGQEDYVFLNRRGKKLTREMIFLLIKKYAKLAGIDKKVSPHTFRHSFATHLVEGGADLKAVQDMLGHESIITTEIYTHLDKNYLRDVLLTHHPLYKKEQ